MYFQTNGIGKVHIIWRVDEKILRGTLKLYERVFGGCSAKMIRSQSGGRLAKLVLDVNTVIFT